MTTYTNVDFKTKRELKQALIGGQLIRCLDQTPFGPSPILEGSVTLSGPHYPRPHTWYATGEVHMGYLRSIDGMTRVQKDEATRSINQTLVRVRIAAERAFNEEKARERR